MDARSNKIFKWVPCLNFTFCWGAGTKKSLILPFEKNFVSVRNTKIYKLLIHQKAQIFQIWMLLQRLKGKIAASSDTYTVLVLRNSCIVLQFSNEKIPFCLPSHYLNAKIHLTFWKLLSNSNAMLNSDSQKFELLKEK